MVVAAGLDVSPLTDGNASMLATGTDFAVAVVAGGRVLAKVWDDRTSAWIDRSALIRPPRAAAYALAATGDYIALAAGDVVASRAELRIWHRVRGEMDFAEARIDVSRLNQVAWDPDGTLANFWALGSGFACMTYFTAGAQPPRSYTQKILQWNDAFAVRTTFDKRYTIDPQRELPYGRSSRAAVSSATPPICCASTANAGSRPRSHSLRGVVRPVSYTDPTWSLCQVPRVPPSWCLMPTRPRGGLRSRS